MAQSMPGPAGHWTRLPTSYIEASSCDQTTTVLVEAHRCILACEIPRNVCPVISPVHNSYGIPVWEHKSWTTIRNVECTLPVVGYLATNVGSITSSENIVEHILTGQHHTYVHQVESM